MEGVCQLTVSAARPQNVPGHLETSLGFLQHLEGWENWDSGDLAVGGEEAPQCPSMILELLEEKVLGGLHRCHSTRCGASWDSLELSKGSPHSTGEKAGWEQLEEWGDPHCHPMLS